MSRFRNGCWFNCDNRSTFGRKKKPSTNTSTPNGLGNCNLWRELWLKGLVKGNFVNHPKTSGTLLGIGVVYKTGITIGFKRPDLFLQLSLPIFLQAFI